MAILKQKIVPHLWFDKEAKEAAEFYASVFPDSRVTNITTLHDTPSGDCDVVSFELSGQPFMAISAGPLFKFNESISFIVSCETQDEVDYYWEKLSAVPEAEQCGWLKELSDDAIEVMLRFAAEKPSAATGVALQEMHGAAARVAPDATAFPHRDSHYDFLILSQWADPADSAKNIEWTRALFEMMQPFLERGVYVNDLGEEGEDRVRAAYGANYERLAALKAKYDPTNFFRVNQNVAAAGHSHSVGPGR